MFNDDPNAMLDEHGNYDFNKREERNYHHSYSYFGGYLGQEELEKEKQRKKLLGKLGMPVCVPPNNEKIKNTIEHIAKHVIAKKTDDERRIFEKMIREKNFKDYTFSFLDPPSREVCGLGAVKSDDPESSTHAIAGDKGELQIMREYYLFVKHALERQVDYKPLVEEQIRIEADRVLKLKKAAGQEDIPVNDKKKDTATPASSSGAVPKNDTPKTKEPTSKPTPAASTTTSTPTPTPAPAAEAEVPMFKDGSKVEVLGLAKRPDLNGQEGTIVKWHADVARYEVKMDKYGVIIKVKSANVMIAKVQSDAKEKAKFESDKFGEFPKEAKVSIFGLQSDAARWLNGQEGVVVGFDDEAKRYEIKLERDQNQIKRVKFENLKLSLPPGWVEHFDEHAQRSYYVNTATNKTSWKHPVHTIKKANQFETFMDANEHLDEAEFGEERDQYDCDNLEEGEGQFDLDDLVNKVRQREQEKGDSEEDGEPDAKKPKLEEKPQAPKKKKKKSPSTWIDLKKKLVEIQKGIGFNEEKYKDMTKVAVTKEFYKIEEDLEKEMDAACSMKREAEVDEDKQQDIMEYLIVGMRIIGEMLADQPKAKFTFQGLIRCADRIEGLFTVSEFLEDVKYVYGLLKTM